MYARMRSTGGTSRLDFARSKEALNTCVRQFSTTSLNAAPPRDDNAANGPPSNRHDRSRAAATEINNLLRTTSGKPPAADTPSRNSAGARPTVVDVKSVPRGVGQGLRGRGGFRGGARGGFRGGPQSVVIPGAGESKFVRAPPGFGARGGSSGGFSRGGVGRGGRGGRGASRGGRGRGGARGGRTAGDKEGEEGGEQRDSKSSFVVDVVRASQARTTQEIELDKQYLHGVAVPFNPSLTLESLTGYGPAIAADGARAKSESVLQGLRTLSGGAKHAPDVQNWGIPRQTVDRLKYSEGVYFFTDKAERAHIEADEAAAARLPDGSIKGPDDNVKKAVVDAVVRGVYEAPGSGAKGYHIRNETWEKSDNESFEAKVASLAAVKAAAQKGSAPAKGKSKKA